MARFGGPASPASKCCASCGAFNNAAAHFSDRRSMNRKSGVSFKSRPFEDAQKLAAARAAQELIHRRSSIGYKGRRARPAPRHARPEV